MPLSAPVIVQAAQRLLLEYGLQDVSMRRLASELDVRPGALYYHVPNKQQLLARVAAEILAPLAAPAESTSVEDLMRSFRRAVLPIRDGGDLMLIAFGLNPVLPPMPALSTRLQERGLTRQSADQRAHILMRFALGAVAAEQNATLLHAAQESPDHGPDATGGAALYDEGLRLLCEIAR
ncbi:TetR family transcriptional regulator [Nesterenkonia sp. HG001]|uniref:TetR family transcriptional regulator n=1 Tax=Nesterenkonia sp. HG001 TaxID=2983207 RepID=UPI002AC71500|nr:TetR family transcriptional regulator [Nesterenkonia sp. HG001]MDZ5079217.1 TetR family transcriptional regulator [Nesterenkonia sp. HG001]